MKSNIIAIVICLFVSLQTFAQEKTLKILAIGNSFSEDAIENYLYDLAKAANKKIVIGNMYIPGASIEQHVNNSKDDKATYSYRKTDKDGTKTSTKDISISQAIQDEDWDYISLQQASHYSGQYNTIEKDLPALISYVNGLKPEKAKLIYHQTWAYQHDSDHTGFANYNNNQLEMYNAIADASKKVNKSKQFSFIVPAGTAIQNARTSSIGDNFTRDGYHLQLDYGRFAAACTWYEKLFNLDVRKNTYKPASVTDLQATIAKEAAHKAVNSPWKISTIKL